MVSNPTHTYRHPDNYGLGHHHAGTDLGARPAHVGLPKAATDAMGLASTMAELDMHHGTQVTHAGRDEDRDLEIVEWADSFGTERRTSVTPEQFAEFFVPVEPDVPAIPAPSAAAPEGI